MDIIDEERALSAEEESRMKERMGVWNPTSHERQIFYMNWCKKQANQRQKTLELDSVTHSKARKDQLRREKRAYEEEVKRMKDLIEDGR